MNRNNVTCQVFKMNTREQEGIRNILSSLEDSTLNALAVTVTQGLLKNKLGSKEDTINAIVTYSPDVLTILKRKVITREILFNYLYKENIKTKGLSKNELIQHILSYWKSGEQLNNNTVAGGDECVISALAEQFTQWFYNNVNTNQSLERDFFEDAKCVIHMESNGERQTDQVENNAKEISELILSVKNRHNLYFNPNLSKEGVSGKMDVHGLVMVMACGTLHINNICVGVFEQMFALARDPFSENNWKIKNSQLVLKSKSDVLLSPPKLTDCSFISFH